MLAAIVGILLGNLLIANLFAPTLQRLRDILPKFAEIELPHRSVWSDEEKLTPAEYRRAQETAAEKFNLLFREYAMTFAAFKKVGGVFAASVLLLACVVAWQFPVHILTRASAMVAFARVICIGGVFLQRAIASTPSQLVSIDFLENNFANLHLESLFDCAHLHANFGRGFGRNDPVMHFSLFQKVMFTGYKFLVVICDDEHARVFYVAYDPVGANVNFQQFWTPELTAFQIPLGDFSLADALLVTQSLRICLWLFVPTPRGWAKPDVQHPRFLIEDITDELGGRVGVRLTSSDCSWTSTDEHTSFDLRHFGVVPLWKILPIDIPSEHSPQALIEMFRQKILQSKGIESRDYPSGLSTEGPR